MNAHAYLENIEKRKKIIVPVIILSIAYLFYAVFSIKLDLSATSFLFKDDPQRIHYVEFLERFGNDSVIIFAVSGDVFTNEYLENIYRLQEQIEADIPFLRDSTSIINTQQLYVEVDENGESYLYVADLLRDFPEKKLTEEELQSLRSTMLTDPVFANRVIDETGTTSSIIVELQSVLEINNIQTPQTSLGEEDLDALFDDSENLDTLFDDSIDTEEPEGGELQAIEEDINDNIYLTNAQHTQVYRATMEIIDNFSQDGFQIAAVGEPLLIPTMIQSMLRDALTIFPLFFLMVVFMILALFRRASAIALVMVVAGFTNIFMLGLMSVTNTPMSIVVNVLPMFMVSISLGAVIHLLVLAYNTYDEGKSKKEAMQYALSHSGWPIMLTSLTSAAGIFSFYFSEVKPLRDFALFGALGLLFALMLTLVLLPLIFLHLPIRRKEKKHATIMTKKEGKMHMFDRILAAHAGIAYKMRFISILLAAAIITISLLGVKNVYFSHRPIDWLPANSKFRQDTQLVDSLLKGSNTLEIFIDTGKDGEVYEPAFLNKVEEIEQFLYNYKSDKVSVGNVVSLNTLIKKTNRVLNEDDPQYYTIPDSRELVSQELLILEGGASDFLTKMSDINYRYFRITAVLPDLDAVYFSQLLQDIEVELDTKFADNPDYTYYGTGNIGLLSRILASTINSARVSYIIAFAVIALLMILLTGNVNVGLISMIPNLLPVFVLLGIVGLSPTINLDLFILLMGCILLGIAVDNTIHFIHVCKSYLMEGHDIVWSVRNTFLSSGKAMVTSSVILMLGFSVLIFARMRNFHNFGVLAVTGVLIALFADFFLTPALMIYMYKWKILKIKPSHKQ